jgi:hypothetical protein
MKINWYLSVRWAVLAFTAYVYFKGVRNSDMWLWAFLSGYVICTFISDSRKTPKEQRVTYPRQIMLEYGRVCYAGTKRQFLNYFGGWDVDPETISMAAIKAYDGTIYAVNRLGRHSDCLEAMRMDGKDRINGKIPKSEFGYITSEGNYVDRYKAVKIARLAGQIPLNEAKPVNPQDQLFSEDVWPSHLELMYRERDTGVLMHTTKFT